MNTPTTVTKTRDYRWGFIVLTLGTYALFGRWPEMLAAWGIRLPFGHWFVDTSALLSASDAFAAGHNPYESNPLDVLNVPHWYSDWWFGLHDLGLTRADAPWLGLGLVIFFLVAVFLLVKPANFAEMLFSWLALCSPAVLLGANRANIDLLIFAALVLAAWLLTRTVRAWRLLVPPLIALLIGLKFYPLAAAAALPFAPAERREKWWMLGFMTLLAALVLLGIYDDILRVRGLITAPIQLYTFGATQLVAEDERGLLVAATALLAGLGLLVFWWRRAPELPAGLDARTTLQFSFGTVTLVGCFFVGVGFNYRLVFGLLLLPLLWTLRREAPAGLVRNLGRFVLAGFLALLWLDGLVCLFINAAGPAGDLASVLDVRRVAYALLSWAWIAAVLGLWVSLARPVCRQLGSDDAK